MKRVWLLATGYLLLSAAAFAQVPNRLDLVRSVAAADPVRFACAHTPASCGHDYIKALACELFKADNRFGLNGKRGHANDLSYDAINFKGEGTDTDPNNPLNPSGKATVIDVIGGAGGPNPQAVWNVVTDPNSPTAAAWVKPCGGAPPPPPPVVKPYPGDQFFIEKIGAVLEADYAEAGQTLNAGSATWFARPIWTYVNQGLTIEQAVSRARSEWRAALGLKP